jgi:hypothetical protein
MICKILKINKKMVENQKTDIINYMIITLDYNILKQNMYNKKIIEILNNIIWEYKTKTNIINKNIKKYYFIYKSENNEYKIEDILIIKDKIDKYINMMDSSSIEKINNNVSNNYPTKESTKYIINKIYEECIKLKLNLISFVDCGGLLKNIE